MSGASLYEAGSAISASHVIDQIVDARLRELDIEPAPLCSDAVFVRRVFLDVIGTLPTVRETREFLSDQSFEKRRVLIDRLLQRPEFADYWAMKWSDLLRIKAEFPINLWPNAAQAYYRWVWTAIRDNLRYDRFAYELLTANGSNFRVGPANFYRAMQNREPTGVAGAVALTFMGTRTERWSAERLDRFARVFSQVGSKTTGEWKEEIVYWNRAKPADGVLSLPDDTRIELSADQDPREAFARWLIGSKNPWFAKAIANRLWAWLLGRGVVHEPDDFHPGNPPSNAALLAYLEAELIAEHYDLKELFRSILASQTYQRSSLRRSDHPEAGANFAFYQARRLDAEVLIDALNQVTGTTERYTSAIPEPFTFVPPTVRAIALPDASITSSFLETFGRPSRDTGREGERNNRITASQRLHLLNSSHIQRKLEQGEGLQPLFRASVNLREATETLYLTILSRYPTPAERRIVESYVAANSARRRTAMVDIAWALINSAEFLYRH